jgi:hypothetical protein
MIKPVEIAHEGSSRLGSDMGILASIASAPGRTTACSKLRLVRAASGGPAWR